MKKIKVVLSSIWYPLAMATYFRRALERREDVELITAGPYTGSWIPWAGGMHVAPKYVTPPTIPLAQGMINQSGRSAAMIESQLPWEPDLWLQVDAGWWVQKPKAGVVAHVATDPHVIQYDQQRRNCDIFFNMQLVYSKPGDRYLPYAYDPTVHYKMEGVRQEHDGCLIGLLYQNRDQLIKMLWNRGHDVYYSLGEIFDEYRLRYNQSKIALSWSSLDDIPTRVFEAMGMEMPLLTNRITDLSNFFVEGEHYVGFSSVPEAIQKFEMLLADEAMREEIAGNAYRKVKEGHTWDHRIASVLETCKLL